MPESRAQDTPLRACTGSTVWVQEGPDNHRWKDCLFVFREPYSCLSTPHPISHKEYLCLHPSPRYDFIFLFNEDKNHHHKSQEKSIFAPHSQAVQKVPAVLGQNKSFLHGEEWGRGYSAWGHHSGPGSLSSGGGHPHPVERWAVRIPLFVDENEKELFHQTFEEPSPDPLS